MAEESKRRVQFDAIGTHEELLAWSRRYSKRAVAVHNLDVSLDAVEWTVSTRARRRAAAVKTPPVADATVGDPIDWCETDLADDSGRAQRRESRECGASPEPGGSSGHEAPPDCELSLSWAAFEEFDRSEWRDTLRHELVHVEQFQRFGTTDHGPEFRERAEDVDAAIHCRRFADARYLLCCDDCGEVVARRYCASKLVKQAGCYRSNCCGAPLTCVEQ